MKRWVIRSLGKIFGHFQWGTMPKLRDYISIYVNIIWRVYCTGYQQDAASQSITNTWQVKDTMQGWSHGCSWRFVNRGTKETVNSVKDQPELIIQTKIMSIASAYSVPWLSSHCLVSSKYTVLYSYLYGSRYSIYHEYIQLNHNMSDSV